MQVLDECGHIFSEVKLGKISLQFTMCYFYNLEVGYWLWCCEHGIHGVRCSVPQILSRVPLAARRVHVL